MNTEKRNELLKTGLFIYNDSSSVRLLETCYLYYVGRNYSHWKEITFSEQADFEGRRKLTRLAVTFDEVLQKVPPDIQEKLLFHIDLFR